VTREVEKKIIVAPGADEKHEMVFKGEGNFGYGVVRSDLFVSFKVKKDPFFAKKGSSLIMTYNIPLSKALKSESIKFNLFNVNSEDEVISYPIDQIITPTTSLVLHDHGFPIQGNLEKRGDLIIRFKIEFPESLSLEKKIRINEILSRVN